MSSSFIHPLKQKLYSGSKTAIIIGIDVGTTFSGVSYALLRPGEKPVIRPVTKFSDQTVTDNKIPSIVYYNSEGRPEAIGAMTMRPAVRQDAEENNWLKVKYFKMHFRPHGQNLDTFGLELGTLPQNKSAEDVMGDFLSYLFRETGKFISGAYTTETWTSVKDEAVFVIGHPNGWAGVPQYRYRNSAIKGGLINDTYEDHKRVLFVTEGEASGLACLVAGIVGTDTLQKGFRFVIADAGGDTLDMTTFEVIESSPLKVRECCIPDSCFAGSIYVNEHVKEILRDRLRNTPYGSEETIEDLIDDKFNASIKVHFNGDSDGLLQVGGRQLHNKELGIKAGYLRLSCEDLRKCFRHSVDNVNRMIDNQFRSSGSIKKETHVWLVGGFANSPYLVREIRSAFEPDGVTVLTPSMGDLAKAVADGAVLHYLDNIVEARVSDKTYGTICYKRFDISEPEHRDRLHLIECSWDGLFIGPQFDAIAKKGKPIRVGKSFKEDYYKTAVSRETARVKAKVIRYDGDLPAPVWYTENEGKFRPLFEIEADLSPVWDSVEATERRSASLAEFLFKTILKPYKNLQFGIELELGGTEVTAKVRWKNGCLPAKVIPLE